MGVARLVLGLLLISHVAYGDTLSNKADKIKNDASKSIFRMKDNMGSWGTGFAVETKNKKYLITNAHVCEGATNGVLTAVSKYKKETVVKILFLSRKTDLCLTEAPEGVETIKFADKAISNENVFVVGYPLTEYMSVTYGKYLGPQRVVIQFRHIPPPMCTDPKYRIHKGYLCLLDIPGLVTTVPTDMGASGSPILNESGKLIGVTIGTTGNISWCMGIDLASVREFLKDK